MDRSAESGFKLDVSRTALVITDPQVDFLSPRGAAWGVVGKSVDENHTVDNIERLLRAARQAHMLVAISPHYYYPSEHRWGFGGPLARLMERAAGPEPGSRMMEERAAHAGAELLPQYRRYLLAGKTVIASPHRGYAPDTGELATRLAAHGVACVVLCGMSANLCVESHLRHLLERGFEVAVVQDATAAASLPGGDGFLAATINFRYLASALWRTDEALEYL